MRSDLIDNSDILPSTAPIGRYWRRNLRLIAGLLAVWALVTFGIGYFARELQFSVLGWPFSFWVAGQGALVVYVAIVAYYAWAMNRLDRSMDLDKADPGGAGRARPDSPAQRTAQQSGHDSNDARGGAATVAGV